MATYTWLIGASCFETAWWSHLARVEKTIEEFFIGFLNTVRGFTLKYSPQNCFSSFCDFFFSVKVRMCCMIMKTFARCT